MKNILFIAFLILFTTEAWSQNWVWGIKASGNPQYSEDTDIAVDHEGNVVIAGYYELGLRLDTFSLYTDDDYYSDIFLCRMDSAHNIEWLKHIETGSTYDYGIGVCIDDDKNIYLTGGRNGKIFVSKYDSTGNELWFCDFNKEYYGQGNDVAIDQFDNVYITGKNGGNTFVAKIDFYGVPIWTKRFMGCNSNGCQGNDIAVDCMGTIYLTGSFECDSLMIDDIKIENNWQWGEQTFVTKISSIGIVQWAKTPIGKTNSIPQITLNRNGILISTVVSTSEMDFGNGIVITKTAGGNDGSPLIAQYDFDGNIEWAKIINTYHGGTGSPRDIITDSDDNIYLIGESFGNYGGTEMDFYVEKYDRNGDLQFNKLYQTSVSEYGHGLGIDNFGNAYIVGYSQIINFIGDGIDDWPSSVGIAKLKTNSTTNLRPSRPKVERLNFICSGEQFDEISAIGTNIRWYGDKFLKELLYEGNTFNNELVETDTLYVTQTINGVESWSKEVIIHFSKLPNTFLNLSNDTLLVNQGDYFKYQWYLNGDSIQNGNKNYMLVDTIGTFSVNIKEGDCVKWIDTTIVQSSIEKFLKKEDLLLFPNPTIDGAINLVMRINSNAVLYIRVYNLNGSNIINRKLNIQNGLVTDKLDFSGYSKGIYIINIFGDGLNITKKILKQ
ncbi:MAG TPA: SBBP repeat-containing protein [Bacteroidales bacterium]|nr:SBBP repeat-containing protein [Bacteroidales bacterium]